MKRFAGILASLWIGWAAPLFAAAPDWRDHNVLLITVDCLRPDHLGIYGYGRPTSPHIDRFFKNALRFDRAFAQSAWTSPGILSLLTGLYPSVHGMDAKGKYFDPAADTPLTQLREEGYVAMGYDTSQNYADPGWSGRVKKNGLLDTLRELGGRKFFVWYHYRETHLPYSPPEPHRSRFFKGPYRASPEHLDTVSREEKIPLGSVTLTPEDAPAVRDLYDAEVAWQDAQLAELFEYLETSGLARKTIVILTADHAEELLEHGFIGHASTSLRAILHDEVTRIPLLIRLPGADAGRVMDNLAEQVDLMPTLFELLGIAPRARMQGASLLSSPEKEAVYAETSFCGWQCPESGKDDRIHALRTRRWKLIEERTGDETAYSLYDLAADPGETRNVYAAREESARELRARLAAKQEANLRSAFERASGMLRAHIETAENAVQNGDAVAARDTAEQAHHLEYVYGRTNPSFLRREEYIAHWREMMKRLWAILGEEKSAPPGRR